MVKGVEHTYIYRGAVVKGVEHITYIYRGAVVKGVEHIISYIYRGAVVKGVEHIISTVVQWLRASNNLYLPWCSG